ncbi:MAG: hypothetical protein GC168_20395 [Candidatus Hydrogenedens sp.]|nr:hypothetical protein [Candidatus Hydrogenedens sp.]
MNDGARVETRDDWAQRRKEMIAILEDLEYGHAPPMPEVTAKNVVREEVHFEASGLWAEKVTVTLVFHGVEAQAGYWKPRGVEGPLPVLLACEPVWWDGPFVTNGIAEKVVKAGYLFAGFQINDFASYEDEQHCPARDAYPDYDWGTAAVGAWAYGVTMNWIETLPEADAKHVAIWGHSRRGKACAWAGATDERFAAVIPHMSGMGGTAAYRVRNQGAQQLEGLLERYWLHPPIYEYIDREEDLPFDQHWLHALAAPRALYAHTGLGDAWGNPLGEQAAWQAALPVYRWLGAEDALGIYFGDYGHYDPNGPEGGDSWDTALEFLDWHFRGKPPAKVFNRPHFSE